MLLKQVVVLKTEAMHSRCPTKGLDTEAAEAEAKIFMQWCNKKFDSAAYIIQKIKQKHSIKFSSEAQQELQAELEKAGIRPANVHLTAALV